MTYKTVKGTVKYSWKTHNDFVWVTDDKSNSKKGLCGTQIIKTSKKTRFLPNLK